MDETLDTMATDATTQTGKHPSNFKLHPENTTEPGIQPDGAVQAKAATQSNGNVQSKRTLCSTAAGQNAETTAESIVESDDQDASCPMSNRGYPDMTELDISRYAQQANVKYPTIDGDALYQLAAIIPQHLRAAFEGGLGIALDAYRAAVAAHGQEPVEQPIPDILALYLSLGFVSTEALYEGYQHACRMGHKMLFLYALKTRNSKAIEHLKAFVAGQRYREYMVIATLPKFGPGGNTGVSEATGIPFAN